MRTLLPVLLLGISIALPAPATIQRAEDFQAPQIVVNRLQFPLSSALEGLSEGFAEVHFIVDSDGTASEFIVVEATHEVFARAALRGLQESQFQSASFEGESETVRTIMHLHFRETGVVNYSAYDRVQHPLPYMTRFSRPAFSLSKVEELDSAPRLIQQPENYFPVDEEERLLTGSVHMEYYIDRDGQTRLAIPLEPAHPAIVEAAILSIAGMRYEIPRKGAKPVPVRVRQTIVFTGTGS